MVAPTPDWDAFDPERYLEHNYREVLHADRWLFLRLIDDVRAAVADESIRAPLRSADVGTGPNLYPLLATTPYVATAEALDVGASNRRYLLRQLAGLDPLWRQWIALAREHGEDLNEARVRATARVGATSILALPVRAYDLVTSFFCAESFTNDPAVFTRACEHLVGAARQGGLVAGAFMLGSTGYGTAGREFPAVPIQMADLEEIFRELLTDLRIETVPGGAGVRTGYTGMAYLTGRSPLHTAPNAGAGPDDRLGADPARPYRAASGSVRPHVHRELTPP